MSVTYQSLDCVRSGHLIEQDTAVILGSSLHCLCDSHNAKRLSCGTPLSSPRSSPCRFFWEHPHFHRPQIFRKMILRTGGKTKKKTLLTLHFLSTAHVTMTRYEPSNQQFTLIHTLSHRSNRLVKQKLFPSQLKQCHCLYNLSLWHHRWVLKAVRDDVILLEDHLTTCALSLWTTKVPLFKRQVNYSLAERGSKFLFFSQDVFDIMKGLLWVKLHPYLSDIFRLVLPKQ